MRIEGKTCRHGLAWCKQCHGGQKTKVSVTKPSLSKESAKKDTSIAPIKPKDSSVSSPRTGLIGCTEKDIFEIGGKKCTGKELLTALNVSLRLCRDCGKPRAKGSNSYCREHERERLKKWREERKIGNSS